MASVDQKAAQAVLLLNGLQQEGVAGASRNQLVNSAFIS